MKKCSSEMHQFELTDPVHTEKKGLKMQQNEILLQHFIKIYLHL